MPARQLEKQGGLADCVAVCYSVLQVCCRVLPCDAVCYSVLRCVLFLFTICTVISSRELEKHGRSAECVAVCCVVLRGVAVCCSAFQSVAECSISLYSVHNLHCDALSPILRLGHHIYGVAIISRLLKITGLFCRI